MVRKDNDTFEKLLESEKEWRRFIVVELKEIKKTQNTLLTTVSTLKIKMGIIVSIAGSVFGLIGSTLKEKLKLF